MSVKYGSVNLINAVSIVTSVRPFHEFVQGLAGEYVDAKKLTHKAEDINQGYRRFPVFMEISRRATTCTRQWLLRAESSRSTGD